MNTNGEPSTSTLERKPPPTIQSGDHVLIRQPNGDVRSVKIERDSCVNFNGAIALQKTVDHNSLTV